MSSEDKKKKKGEKKVPCGIIYFIINVTKTLFSAFIYNSKEHNILLVTDSESLKVNKDW
jgi:hypothetical protein